MTTTEAMENHAMLTEARGLLAAGWMQRAYHNADSTRFCADGALRRAAWKVAYSLDLPHILTNGLVARAKRFLMRHVPTNDHIVAWNDDPDRTHADVLAAFDAAIVEAKAALRKETTG